MQSPVLKKKKTPPVDLRVVPVWEVKLELLHSNLIARDKTLSSYQSFFVFTCSFFFNKRQRKTYVALRGDTLGFYLKYLSELNLSSKNSVFTGFFRSVFWSRVFTGYLV